MEPQKQKEMQKEMQEEMRYKLSCVKLYEDEDFYWFSEMQFNGFYKVDKKTLESELLFHFPEESLGAELLFQDIAKVGDWFVFSPLRAKNIVLYNEKTKEVKSLSLKNVDLENKVKYIPSVKFSSLFVYDDSVFFVPFTYPAIVKLDMTACTLTYLESPIEQIEQVLAENRHPFLNFYFGLAIGAEDKIYLPVACGSYVAIFHMSTMHFALHPIRGTMLAFHNICKKGDLVYLGPRIGSDLSCWNEKTGDVETITLSLEENMDRSFVHSPFFYQDQLYYSAGLGSAMYLVDLQRRVAEEVTFVNDIFPKNYELPYTPLSNMFCVRQEENLVHFISGKTHDWYTVNLETKESSFVTIYADPVGQKIMSEKSLYLHENAEASLAVLCDYLMDEKYQKESKQLAETIGKTILDATTQGNL